MTTNIAHSFSADIDMTIKSPAGTIVTLTSDNGSTLDNVFNGTVWNDDADPGTQVPYTAAENQVIEHTYANLAVATPLTPEEALGSFVGENPNGTWTLTVSDDTSLDGGTLGSWSLGLSTAVCAPRAAPPPPTPDTTVTGASATAREAVGGQEDPGRGEHGRGRHGGADRQGRRGAHREGREEGSSPGGGGP